MDERWVIEVDGRPRGWARLAASRAERALGLLAADAGPVLVLPRTRSVHTFGMAHHLDVALCTEDGRVGVLLVLAPNRVSWPRRGLRTVVEAPTGTFAAWGLHVGSHVGLRPVARSAGQDPVPW